MPEPSDVRRRYIPALDGLRAVAVLAVILYHLDGRLVPGGLLGVGVFFTLSGYLITDLLVAEWDGNGALRLGRFWARRARRLLPALGLMLLVVVAWVAVAEPGRIYGLPRQVLAAALYVSNWWDVYGHVPYFARWGPPSPLGHLWSLAVEEQFYLVWPFLLVAGLRWVRSRRALAGCALGLALVSAAAMACLYVPGANPDRVYYGTDTRAFALLAGAALALLRPARAAAGAGTGRWLGPAGIVSLAAILGCFVATDAYQAWMYRGGMFLLALATAVVIAAAVEPGTWLGRTLGARPLRWLGVRSYAVYLWQYPIIVLTTPVTGGAGLGPRAALQVAVTVLIAAASWRWVEEPIRRGAASRWLPGWSAAVGAAGARPSGFPAAGDAARARPGDGVRFRAAWSRRLGVGACAAAVVGVAAWDAASLARPFRAASFEPVPALLLDHGSEDGAAGSGVGASGVGRDARGVAALGSGASSTDAEQPPGAAASGVPVPAAPPVAPGRVGAAGTQARGKTGAPAPSSDAPPGASSSTAGGSAALGRGVTAIGDSIMIDLTPDLRNLLPGIVIDATVGEQLIQAPPVVADLRAEHRLGTRVVLELGTNGPFAPAQLSGLIGDLGPVQRVVLVNTRDPRAWQDVVNRTIEGVAATVPHCAVVDWYAASAGHPGYFYPDGVHLDPEGAAVLAGLIAQAMFPSHRFPAPPGSSG